MRHLLIVAFVMLTLGSALAQNNANQPNPKVNTVVVNTTGDVTLRQGETFTVDFDMDKQSFTSQWDQNDSVLSLNGTGDFVVTLEELNYLTINSTGDVITDGTLNGKKLTVDFNSTGDSKLDLNYDKIYVNMGGTGDLVLRGNCDDLFVNQWGTGDLDTEHLKCLRQVSSKESLSELLAELGANLEHLSDSVDWESFERDMERWGESMEEWGRHMEEWGEQFERKMEGRDYGDKHWYERRNEHPRFESQQKGKNHKEWKAPAKKSLLFIPHWSGVDAGLNLLLGPGSAANFEDEYSFLELKPLKSWVFNFNIADVGIAFSRNHVAGLYTGIGLGWNNYSFNKPVRLAKGNDHLEGNLINETVEGKVKKSKLGVLYVQAPLMLEVRPSRGFFLAAGVTGGIRVDTWTKVKFMDRFKEKTHSDYYVNLLKLDATFRAGSSDFGFFASFNLLPLFIEQHGPTAHTLNVGFSMIF